MKLNDLLDEEDWDALGEDPEQRFLRLLDIANLKMSPIIRQAEDEFGHNSSGLLYVRYGIQTALLGAAKAEEVTEFEDEELKPWSNYTIEDADSFDAKLNLYHAQKKVALRKRDAEVRVALSLKSAQKLKADFARVRAQIEAAKLKPSKRADLLRRLKQIEDELAGRNTVNMMKTVWLMTQIMMIPGALGETYDLVDGPAMSVLKVVAESQAQASRVAGALVSLPYSSGKPLAITYEATDPKD